MGTYSYGTYLVLPTDDADLSTTMTAAQLSALAAIDNIFVGTNLSNQIAVQQYKNTASANLVNLNWVGQGDRAPSLSPIVLQAYNYSTAAWVWQASNGIAATNATLTLAPTLGTTSYLSPGGYTTCRVYQDYTGGVTLMDSCAIANYDSFTGMYNTGPIGVGQSFTGNGQKITSLQLDMQREPSPSGNIIAYIYAEAHATAFGTDSLPTGGALATSNAVDSTTLPASFALVTFTFPTPYQTVNGTKYVLVIVYQSPQGYAIYAGRNTTDAHAGNYVITSDGTNWSYDAGKDLIFYVYGTT